MIGVLTTWNQPCGLATYARYLTSELEEGSYLILGESAPGTSSDCIRCWQREADDYSKLEEAVRQHSVQTLILNCHYRFFNKAFFSALNRIRSRGVRVFSLIHNPFTVDPLLRGLIEESDGVIVHTEENKLEIVANGGKLHSTHVVEHGVKISNDLSREAARDTLNIPRSQDVVVSFGFVQPHKGLEHVINALVDLDSHYYVVGGAHQEDANSVKYLELLKQHAKDQGVGERVHFIEGFVAEEKVDQYLRASDVIVMNYQSNYYEASGAVAKALGSCRAVITSTAPCFARLGSAVFHTTTGYPLDVAIRLVLKNSSLKAALEKGANDWAEKHCWKSTTSQIKSLIGEKPMKILFQNRPNSESQPGGDTVVINKLSEGLRAKGFTVEQALGPVTDYSSYDLVHLFNFATPEITERYARDCVQAGVPYVVTALYEDRPSFYNQMFTAFELLASGQSENLEQAIGSTAKAERWENAWTAEHANLLLATGSAEAEVLRKDYPGVRVSTFTVGCDIVEKNVSADEFSAQFGVKDYVLCVGRLETRKNQLALLKALENDDIPLVFVDGGFSYQPEYDQACRDFKRKGRTIFTGRLSPEMLASAYLGAKVHALPSWYELPGLVSLEAARYNTNVVVSELGTSKDYFGSLAFYANPGSPQSIRNAVLAGFYAPVSKELKALAEGFTWDKCTESVIACYSRVIDTEESAMRDINLAAINAQAAAKTVQGVSPDVNPNSDVERILEKGDKLAKEGVYEKAVESYREALSISPRSIRAYRSMGAVFLSQSRLEEAKDAFEHALSLDSKDARSLAGMASIQIAKGGIEEAFLNFKLATEYAPEDLSVILLFINSAFLSGRFAELEKALKNFLEIHPDNTNIQYCLAGCLFRQGRIPEAQAAVRVYLLHGGEQERADELMEAMKSDTPNSNEAELLAQFDELKSRSRYDEVIKQIEEKVDLNSLSSSTRDRVRVVLGECLALVGDFSRARGVFKSIPTASGSWAKAQTGLGAVNASEEKWIEAKECFDAALKEDPKLDSALAGLGMCLNNEGKKAESFSCFSSALNANPENLRALLGVIELGYTLGELGQIEHHVEAYLEYHPANLNILYAKAGCLFTQGRSDECLEVIQKIKAFEPEHKMACELEKAVLGGTSLAGA